MLILKKHKNLINFTVTVISGISFNFNNNKIYFLTHNLRHNLTDYCLRYYLRTKLQSFVSDSNCLCPSSAQSLSNTDSTFGLFRHLGGESDRNCDI